MTFVHHTSIVHPGVQLGDDVYIGPYCIIGEPAEIAANWHEKPRGRVSIGSGTIITGNVTIDSGSYKMTYIGENCYIMKSVHIGHDAELRDRCVLSPGARIGGEVVMKEDCNIGMNAVIHQQVTIPRRCMIGMGAALPKKRSMAMKECQTWAGNPARLIGPNKKWLKS